MVHRLERGFCNHCLKLAVLIEDNLDVDSDGVCLLVINFKERRLLVSFTYTNAEIH